MFILYARPDRPAGRAVLGRPAGRPRRDLVPLGAADPRRLPRPGRPVLGRRRRAGRRRPGRRSTWARRRWSAPPSCATADPGHAPDRPRRGEQHGRDPRQRRLHAGDRRGRWRRSASALRRSTRTARSSPSPALELLTDLFALPRWLPVRQRVQRRGRPARDRDRGADRRHDASRGRTPAGGDGSIPPPDRVPRRRAGARSPWCADALTLPDGELGTVGSCDLVLPARWLVLRTNAPPSVHRPGQTRREAGTQSQGSSRRPPGRRSR